MKDLKDQSIGMNKSKIETKEADTNNFKRFPLDASFQGVNRLFVLAFENTNNGNNKVERDSHRKYFLPRVNITNYNVFIYGESFYDQPISDQIKRYDDVTKVKGVKGDDYTTGCLLDYKYFKKHYQLTAVDLSKQKELDADPRTVQQIEFYGKLETNSQVSSVLEKRKETISKFCKLLGPLLKTGLPLLKSVIKQLGSLGLAVASSAIDAGIQKKIYSGSGTTTLVI